MTRRAAGLERLRIRRLRPGIRRLLYQQCPRLHLHRRNLQRPNPGAHCNIENRPNLSNPITIVRFSPPADGRSRVKNDPRQKVGLKTQFSGSCRIRTRVSARRPLLGWLLLDLEAAVCYLPACNGAIDPSRTFLNVKTKPAPHLPRLKPSSILKKLSDHRTT
jgi:hypothetical protein